MMGRINTPDSFRQTITYCLEDKHLSQSQGGEALFKDRAEILWYHQCFGNKRELIRQFNEVARLKPNMSKPVFHISLSLPPGERLTKGALVNLAFDCARSLGFDRHQYLAILHKDTAQQHLHLVANRIGFDRHTVSDSFSRGKIADYCRDAERRLGLRQELGPRRYLTKEQRKTPRKGMRLDKLKQQIEQALQESRDYPQFEQNMQQRGYRVLKGKRGITFMDEKKVFIKGSDTGYPLRTIDKTLAIDLDLRLREKQRQEQRKQQEQEEQHQQQRHRHRDRDYGLSL
ncbi:MAG TPA: relaxase/mobilization nuclease domain-containing protein [Puia sp.]|nr:relaxase/mobilization nuclease domain-containing protein [Puia sp.]